MKRIKESDHSKYYQTALRKGLINKDDDSIIFIDLSIIDDRINRVRSNLPDNFLQATAVKSNPLSGILNHLKNIGSGFECASMGELFLALNTNIQNSKIILDSPVINYSDINFINKEFSGGNVNMNSLYEIKRYNLKKTNFNLGLRINPLVNDNTDDYLNISSSTSKFGEPISNKKEIIRYIHSNTTINTLHVHVGSQNSDTENTVKGIRKVIDIANEINIHKNIIKIINIGGGFPVNYSPPPDYNILELFSKLRRFCPELFNYNYKVITEFGRFVHANAGWLISRIEHIKETPHINIAIINMGADMFLRECYSTKKLRHSIKALDSKGNEKDISQKYNKYSIAGPLCFAGDFIGYNYSLPILSNNDHIVIKDIGANTFSLWSRHCSRPFPKVITYSSDLSGTDMAIIKQRESFTDLLKFWS